jgi:hypothetical protein
MPTGPARSGRPDDKLRMVEGASAARLAPTLHAPSTAQTRGPPPPLRFATRGRISEIVLATRPRPSFAIALKP